MIVTTLPEQAMGDDFVDVELVKYRIRVLESHRQILGTIRIMSTHLAQARSEYDDLVYLTHQLQEVVDARPLDHIDVVPVIFYFHRNHEIRVGYCLMKRVNGDARRDEVW